MKSINRYFFVARLVSLRSQYITLIHACVKRTQSNGQVRKLLTQTKYK